MVAPVEVAEVVKHSGLAPEVQMVVLIFLLVLMVGGPLVYWFTSTNKRRVADGHVADAEGGLYQHLSTQVQTLTERLDVVHQQYNEMFKENALLKSRISQLEACEETVRRLQDRLNQKDEIIRQRDLQLNNLFVELRARDQKIIDLQERLGILELRLARDERQWEEVK